MYNYTCTTGKDVMTCSFGLVDTDIILEWTKLVCTPAPGSLFVRDSLCPGVHVMSDVIAYHCSACRRRGTIEGRLTSLRNT